MENKKQLPLRIGVGIVLLNHKNEILVGKRIDNPKNFWQMPQGGTNENESFLEAAKRELEEETGIKSINLLGKVLEGKYRGQKQKWFIMKFIGKNDEINVNTKNPEFLDWKWVSAEELPIIANNFKINIYKKLKEELDSLNLN